MIREARRTLPVLALELLDEVVGETVVEVLTTKMGVTSSSQDFEDTIVDRQEGHIEGSSSEIVDNDLAFTLRLLVETVGDGGGGGLVDDTEDVETGNDTGVLGGLSLVVL